MTDRRIEIANISRVNEIIQDDPKALIIHTYDNGLFAVNYYESKGARKRREAQEAQIRQYQEWKAKEQQQPTPANSEVRRGQGRPPKTQQPQPPIQQTSVVPTPAAVVTSEKKKSRFSLRREKSPEVAQLQNRCIVCGSPNANIIRFHVPGAPTEGETRFCKTHSNITDLTNIPLHQVG